MRRRQLKQLRRASDLGPQGRDSTYRWIQLVEDRAVRAGPHFVCLREDSITYVLLILEMGVLC